MGFPMVFLWFSYGFTIYDMVLPTGTVKVTGHWQYACRAARRVLKSSAWKHRSRISAGGFCGIIGEQWIYPLVMTNSLPW